jgi:uncharacterized protein
MCSNITGSSSARWAERDEIQTSSLPIAGTLSLQPHGGFIEILVKLNEKVEVGQRVAIQRNTFGEVVANYSSAVAGEVCGYRTDATAEPGTPLVFVFYNALPQEDPVDYAE